MLTSNNFTDASLSGVGQILLTHEASFNSNTALGLDFATFWTDTRGNDGPRNPADGDAGDFIGVNSFIGANSPDVAADGSAVVAGVEQNFEFNDGDGRLDLVFGDVDTTGFTNRTVSFNYWISDLGFEAGDLLEVTLTDGVNNHVTTFGDVQLEANASADDGTANWRTQDFDLEALGLTGNTITLTISVDNNANDENIFVDNILFAGDVNGATIPEPPAWILAALAVPAALMLRRRRVA